MSADAARAVADAVLFEGYVLYPYRANDAKNRVRWQFGVLAPPAFAAVDPSERSALRTDCLVEGRDVALTVHVRFLQVQRRTVEAGDDIAGYRSVGELDAGEAIFLPWDEAVVREATLPLALPGTSAATGALRIEVPGGIDLESLVVDGHTVGRLVRERLPLAADLAVTADPLPGPYGVRRVRVELHNRSHCGAIDRAEALRHALVAAHVLLEVEHGAFVSLIDPPEWARAYAAGCEQAGVYPVLAGPPGDRRVVLAAPIILYDHPEVAPESVAEFCDATEMDELLTLRTLTLTDVEKRQARGSDPRAAALVDTVDDLPPELMDRLHGAIRSMTRVARPVEPPPAQAPWWDPVAEAAVDPDTDVVVIDGFPVGRGTAVRLRPGTRRADAQDMFLDGRTATVEAVLFDAEGSGHLAVTLDELAGLSADSVNPHGRYLYFAPDEVEPITPEGR